MNAIQGTFSGGQIHLDGPVNWPEGMRVRVEPMTEILPSLFGMSEEEQSDDPAAIAAWLAKFDAIEPWDGSAPEDEAEVAAFQQAVRRKSLDDVRRRMEAGE
jgi:hypothetical protein